MNSNPFFDFHLLEQKVFAIYNLHLPDQTLHSTTQTPIWRTTNSSWLSHIHMNKELTKILVYIILALSLCHSMKYFRGLNLELLPYVMETCKRPLQKEDQPTHFTCRQTEHVDHNL